MVNIEECVNQYGDYLYHIAYVYTKDTFLAEEVVQDVFFRLYRTQQFEERASLKTYLTRITINCCYDYLRKWKAKKVQLFDYFGGHSKGLEQIAVANHEKHEIIQQILKLPLKYREVLFLYYYDDLSIAEISSFIHIPESTVRTRLQRARLKLKDGLPISDWEVLRNE